jgi:hypothetical protein
VAATPDLGLACTIARTSRPSIAGTAARDLGKALVEGDFPEDSPFAIDEEFDCQEVTGSDTAPSPNGVLSAAGVPGPEGLPAVKAAPPAPPVAGKLPRQAATEQKAAGGAGVAGQEVLVPLGELAELLPPETVIRLTLGAERAARPDGG